MKLFFKAIISILLICLVGFVVLIIYNNSQRPDYKPSDRTVHVVKHNNKFSLIRNGKPFVIQGAAGDPNLKELSEIGGNTLRVYDTVNLNNILNEAEKYNIAVIVDIPIARYDKLYFNYKDKDYQKEVKQEVQELVSKYKNHSALLIWNLGNEIDFPFTLFGNGFTRTYNELINIIHEVDPNHPVSTSIKGRRGFVPLFLNAPKLDIFSYNVFGALHELENNLRTLGPINGTFPYYLSEWGNNGPWESTSTSWSSHIEPFSSEKAKQIKRNNEFIIEHNKTNSIGALIFYWGKKQETTHTWFSLFDQTNQKSQQIETIHSLWDKTVSPENRFTINHIEINNTAVTDSLFLNSESLATANVSVRYKDKPLNYNGLIYKWELYPESWQYTFSSTQKKPQKIEGRIVADSNHRIVFKTPKNEGAYRLFVTIYDNDNFFATANLPFYILK